MKSFLALSLSLIILLSACAPAESRKLSAYFPDGEILEDIGADYDELNKLRSFEDRIDPEHPYTHKERLPDRYQFALSTPHTACGIDFTPVYSFMFTETPPNGFVQVMYLHHNYSAEAGDAAKYQEILQTLSADFSNSYGDLRPMYGFEDTLSEFLKKPVDEQIKALEGDERIALNSYWTVKESIGENPRTDLIAKISFLSANDIDSTGINPIKTSDKQYGIWVYYTVEKVPDWLEWWMENPEEK